MLTTINYYLRLVFIPILFIGGFWISLYTIFKETLVGFIFMVSLIPQPNIWYKFHNLPLGKDFMDVLFFAVLLGCFIQKKGFSKTWNGGLLVIFLLVSYIELWNSSSRFCLPLPLTHANELLYEWKNYAQMIFLYFFALNIAKREDSQKILIIVMAIVVLFISIRAYRNFSGGAVFSYDKRYGGPFEAVGLGANHLGAFIAYCWAMFLGMFLFDDDKWRKRLFLATILFAIHPLFFAYSRGAYLAALGAMTFYGLVKKRRLLVIVVVVLIAWQTLLPTSVVDRIEMTRTEDGRLEESAELRVELWEKAVDLFHHSPIFGIGFDGFRLSLRGHRLTDTHNFYLKTLCEQGIVGFCLLLLVLYRAFLSGWKLFRKGRSSFHVGLGFGFIGTVLAMALANVFGDRWSYFVLGSYFWLFWGVVDRGILIIQETGASANEG